jgi:ribosomal 50S subunit-associated protein YjgA (DUF615 family)
MYYIIYYIILYYIILCGAETYLEGFVIWCCRRMEKISLTDRVRQAVVSHRIKEERNIVHTLKRRKANWIGHILRRNCLLKQNTEGKIEGSIEVAGRRGRRCCQLLDDLEETRGYWKLEHEALEGSPWRQLAV